MTHLVYEDTFETKKSSAFRESDSRRAETYFSRGGTFTLIVKDFGDNISCPTVGELEFEDFDVSVDVLSTGGAMLYGIAFRQHGALNGYRFWVDPFLRRYQLSLNVEGETTELKEITPLSDVINAEANSLRVVAQDSKIELFINDSLVYDTNDSTHKSGRIGLCGNNLGVPDGVLIRFDNLEIYGPPP